MFVRLDALSGLHCSQLQLLHVCGSLYLITKKLAVLDCDQVIEVAIEEYCSSFS